MSPRKKYGKHCHRKQAPFDRAFYDEKRKNKKKEYKRTHIDRTGSAGLLAPILRKARSSTAQLPVKLLERLYVLMVTGIFLCRLVLRQCAARAALDTGHEERPRLAYAVAPLRDVLVRQA